MPFPPKSTMDSSYDTSAFAAGLLNPAIEKPLGVSGPDGGKAEKRYNVYRNNVTVSLINAVADIFPAIQRIVGEDNFRMLARAYVRARPPKSPLLFLYGQDFAQFIEGFEPAKHLPFLPDIARVERSWLTAYHAADLPPLDPSRLGQIQPERLGDIHFKIHPATSLITSQFPIHDIFLMNRGFMDVAPVQMETSQNIMLTRPETDTRILTLDDGEAAFFQAIIAGQTLNDAATSGTAANAAFDLNLALQMLLGAGVTTHIHLDEQEV